MNNPAKILSHRVRSASGLLRELIDLADDQAWTYRVKDEGLLFFPPPAIARPGFGSVFARDPGTDSAARRNIRDRFKKAGMKFPEEHSRERKAPMTNPNPLVNGQQSTRPAAPPSPESRFASIRQKISATVTLLSEIEVELGQIEGESKKLKALGDALRSLGNLG